MVYFQGCFTRCPPQQSQSIEANLQLMLSLKQLQNVKKLTQTKKENDKNEYANNMHNTYTV